MKTIIIDGQPRGRGSFLVLVDGQEVELPARLFSALVKLAYRMNNGGGWVRYSEIFVGRAQKAVCELRQAAGLTKADMPCHPGVGYRLRPSRVKVVIGKEAEDRLRKYYDATVRGLFE